MDIVYDGVVAKQDRYKYSVKQNNKSNIIIFKLAKQQDSITLNPNKHFYIKVRNSGRTFTDKDPNVVVTENDTMIFVSWTMLRKVTQFKDIDVQVEYYDSENDIKWQTSIVNINLHDNIPVDEEIESKYPSILAQLQKQIDELKVDVLPTVAGTGIKIITKNDKKVISVDDEVVASKDDLDGKVDKVEGKGLSSNDYTNEEKQEVAKVKDKVNKVEGKGLSSNDYTNLDKEAVSKIPNKVDKEANKSLMSQEEHIKLAGVENNATRTIVVASTQNGYIVVNDGQVKVYDDTEIRELIAGKKTAWVIDTENQITGLKDADGNYINVIKIGNLNISLIKVGDDVYIKDDDAPDYWVTSREVEEGVVILSLHKSNTKINLDDYYTKEEINELVEHHQNIIFYDKTHKPKYNNDNALYRLFRYKKTSGVESLEKVVKEVTPAGDVESNCIITRNGVQLFDYDTFNTYFDKSLNELYGDFFAIDYFVNVYSAYYPNIEGSPVSAIRIGTKNPGSINLINFSKSTLKIIAGKYFSYNSSTQQKSYDANSKLVITWNDGVSTTIDLTEDPVEYEVNLTDFDSSYPVEIYASGSSNDGRVFIYGFVAEGEEQVDYSLHDLATEDDIQEVNERIDETNTEVYRVDSKADQIDTKVDSVDSDLQATKETIGHVQIFNAKYLPRASRDYIDKILRVNGVLYQLKVNGEEKEYSFENVIGTTEVKPETWSDFASLITNGFTEDFELAYTENVDWITPVQLIAGKEYRTNNLPDGDIFFFDDTRLNNITITNALDRYTGDIELPYSNIHSLYYNGSDEIDFYDTYGRGTEVYPETSTKPQVYFTCNDPTGFDPNDVGAINYLEEKQINTEYLISKIFRNDGFAKFGSSSVGGKLTIRKINSSLPDITKVVLKVKTWSATKHAGIISSVGTYSEDNVVSANEEVQNITIYNKQTAGSTDVISLESYRPDYGDVRFNLVGIIVTFGEASYEWAPIGGGSSGGSLEKRIELSVRKETCQVQGYNQISQYNRKYLRLTFRNFDSTDVGKKIFLFDRVKGRWHSGDTRKSNNYYFKHHKNYNFSGERQSSCLGFALCAGHKLPDHVYGEDVYSDLPFWMSNEGYLQTEWTLTQEDINIGYVEIEFFNLFSPLVRDYDNKNEWTLMAVDRVFRFALMNDDNTKEQCYSDSLKLINAPTGKTWPRSCVNLEIDGTYNISLGYRIII